MKYVGIFSVMGSCTRFGLGSCGMITLDFWRGGFRKLGTQDFGNSWRACGKAHTSIYRYICIHVLLFVKGHYLLYQN